MKTIGVIGGGAWGTALATTARRAGCEVTLWAREDEVVQAINATRLNPVYLPGVTLEQGLKATSTLPEAIQADAVLVVAPAQFVRPTLKAAAADWPSGVPAVICAKGIELSTGALMTEVVADVLPDQPLMVLSGPTFAKECAQGLPTAVTLSTTHTDLGEQVMAAIGTPTFRPYLSDDPIGAEVGGAVKNVLAIACGIVEGRALGDNARAALITRGLAEIVRLAVSRGGKPETLMGLSGLGDLILTCSSQQSRNYSLGYALGQGQSLEDVLGSRRAVTEGVFTAQAVVELAVKLNIDMPICQAMDQILNQGADIGAVIEQLLARPFRPEKDA